MTTLFWDVDTQVDFIMPDGKLAVPGAESLIPVLAALTDYAHDHGIRIVASADDHDIGHAEISDHPDWSVTFPPHCMRGTDGQRRIAATTLRNPLVIHPVPLDPAAVARSVRDHDGDILLNKPGTDVFRWNPSAGVVLDALDPDRVVVYGVATDICTRAAVNGIVARRPDAEVTVIVDAIRGIDAVRSDRCLLDWRERGIGLLSAAAWIDRC